jgi:hypothetical protein
MNIGSDIRQRRLDEIGQLLMREDGRAIRGFIDELQRDQRSAES